ncbi:MAG: TraB/GumN family protein [Bacteroidetes bacterium]|nr:TraB/GumN family protein [Bacteroidota bacterium]
MKKNVLVPIALLVSTLLFSQNRNALPNTLLWKIAGKDIKKPSYLFGTMHILCAEDAVLSDSLKAVIHNCEDIYFEIDLGDFSGMLNSMKYMRMNDSKKLSDLLSEQDYNKVKSYFENHGGAVLPFSMLERFKPLLISSLIEENDLDCKTTNGMELVIMKEARSDQKKINGLETAEFQAGLFDSIPYEKQARDLVNYIDSVAIYKKMTKDLAAVYHNQDLGKIEELTVTGDATISNYLDLLLYGRNRKWVTILDSLVQKKSLLIAVGAGHLPGEQGVINLLRKKGYEVTPVKN